MRCKNVSEFCIVLICVKGPFLLYKPSIFLNAHEKLLIVYYYMHILYISSEIKTMFEEAEFNQAVEEMNCPKLEDWEFFVETSPEGVHCKIYRQYDQVC